MNHNEHNATAEEKMIEEKRMEIIMRVREAADYDEAEYRRAYEKNKNLEKYTEIADRMRIRSAEDFDRYCETCLGGSIKDEFARMAEKPGAFYRPSRNVINSNESNVTGAAYSEYPGVLAREKRKIEHVRTPDGNIEKKETVEYISMSRKEIERKINFLNWFPTRRVVNMKDRCFPFYPVLSVLICLFVLIIPIFLSIVNHDIEVENKEYDAYIRELNGEIGLLEEELAVKNDMKLIENIAREDIGMIDVGLSNVERVNDSKDNIVLSAEEEEEVPNLFFAFLNALGFAVGEN